MLRVDPDQLRLDNFGRPAPAPVEGHAVQDPRFLLVGAHSAELVPNELTPLGGGELVFSSPERAGAVVFDDLPVVAPGDELWSGPLADVAPGTYRYLRVSVSYQRYRVLAHATAAGTTVSTDVEIASFVEDATYITTYELGTARVEVNAVKEQGYFGAWSAYTGVMQGQLPRGATTVPNPLDASSPIPVGSCVVTAVFDPPLVVPAQASADLTLDVSLSTNGSFEWEDDNADGLWQPFDESVTDMGLRGMQVSAR